MSVVSKNMILYHTKLILYHTKLILYHTKLILYHTKLILYHTKLILYHTKLILNHTKLILNHTKLILYHTKQITDMSVVSKNMTSKDVSFLDAIVFTQNPDFFRSIVVQGIFQNKRVWLFTHATNHFSY